MISFLDPAFVELIGFDHLYDDLKKFLTYKDLTVKYELDRFQKNSYWRNSLDPERYQERLEELKDSQNVCLLKEASGKLITYSGLIEELQFRYPDLGQVEDKLPVPKSKLIPWDKKPEFELRYYQKEALDRLLEVRHGNVSMPTGSGKTLIILNIVKSLGLKSVVIAPSKSIAKQIFELFKHHFSEKYVGFFGDGKKNSKKLFTVGIAASFTRIEPDTEDWKNLSQVQVTVVDESHLTATDTQEKFCTGVFKDSPYRYFFSATQLRNDGSELLLKGIIGKNVYSLTTDDLVNQGFLAKPNFLIYKAESKSAYASKDAMRMISKHIYQNTDLHKKVAEMANKSVELFGHKVLIMIDQVSQFGLLHPYLKFQTEFAHGGSISKENQGLIPEKYLKSDSTDLVNKFNKGEIPILVGTSCISVGTDIKPVDVIYNLQAGKSEVKFTQLVGRGTRTTETKKQFYFVDYDIVNINTLHFHTIARINIYNSFYKNLRYIKV